VTQIPIAEIGLNGDVTTLLSIDTMYIHKKNASSPANRTDIDSAKMHHHICFYCGEHKDGLKGAEILVKTDDYSVLLYQ
jgi:hypothetical protein